MLITINALSFQYEFAAKWHNMNNRGWKPTDNDKLNVSALKSLPRFAGGWILDLYNEFFIQPIQPLRAYALT